MLDVLPFAKLARPCTVRQLPRGVSWSATIIDINGNLVYP